MIDELPCYLPCCSRSSQSTLFDPELPVQKTPSSEFYSAPVVCVQLPLLSYFTSPYVVRFSRQVSNPIRFLIPISEKSSGAIFRLSSLVLIRTTGSGFGTIAWLFSMTLNCLRCSSSLACYLASPCSFFPWLLHRSSAFEGEATLTEWSRPAAGQIFNWRYFSCSKFVTKWVSISGCSCGSFVGCRFIVDRGVERLVLHPNRAFFLSFVVYIDLTLPEIITPSESPSPHLPPWQSS